MGIQVFFLPAVLCLGVLSTLQDLKVRRISNLWIMLSLGYAFIVHLWLVLVGNQEEMLWLPQTLVNVLISTVVALYFWKKNWWGGGDAKLFVCYASLIPLSQYPFGYFSYYFASFLLLILTFVPAAIWTFCHAQVNLIKEGKSIYKDFRPSSARIKEFLQLSLGFIAILFLSNGLNLVFNQYFYWMRELVWLASIGFYKTIFKLFQKRLWLVLMVWVLGACILVVVSFTGHVNVGQVLINSVVSWVLIFILRTHVFRTIDTYVEWTKNNNMAFAGWMFLGVLMILFLKLLVHANGAAVSGF